MKSILGIFCILVLISSCAKKTDKIKYGEATKEEVVKVMGEPIKEELIKESVEEDVVLVYPEDIKFQVRKNIVINQMRNPNEEEAFLLDWKHKKPDCHFKKVKVKNKKNTTHLMNLVEYRCKDEGLSLIFDPNIKQVIRVIEYEKK